MILTQRQRNALLLGLAWTGSLWSTESNEADVLQRCTSPMTLELSYSESTGVTEQRTTEICGLETGKFQFAWSVSTQEGEATATATGRYRMQDGVFDADIELKIGAAAGVSWSGKDLRADNRAINLQSGQNQDAIRMKLSMRPATPRPPGLYRAWLSADETAMAARIAEVTGWRIDGIDTLGEAPITFNFEAISPDWLLQLLASEPGRALWRLGEGEYRLVQVRDAGRVAELQQQVAAALATDDTTSRLRLLESIRSLGRARGPTDVPPDVIDPLIELARLRSGLGEDAKAAQVWREVLEASERADRLASSPVVARVRARLGAALLRAGARDAARKMLSAAQSILAADAEHSADQGLLEELPVAYATIGDLDYARRLLDQGLSRPEPSDTFYASELADVALPMLRWYRRQHDAAAADRLIQRWGTALQAATELDADLSSPLVGDGLEAFGEGRIAEGVELADTFVRLCQLAGMPASGHEVLMQFKRTAGYLALGDYAAAARSQRDTLSLRLRRDRGDRRSIGIALVQLRQLQLIASDFEAHAQPLDDLIAELVASTPAPRRTLDDNMRLSELDQHSAIRHAHVLLDQVQAKFASQPDPRWLPALEARAAIQLLQIPEIAVTSFAEVQRQRKLLGVDTNLIEQRAHWFEDLQRRIQGPP